jgi:hypothetical protein
LIIIGNTLEIYGAAKVIERKELKTNEETVKMLKDFFEMVVPEYYQYFLYD